MGGIGRFLGLGGKNKIVYPEFHAKQISIDLEKFENKTAAKTKNAMAFIGEKIANDARDKSASNSFIDDTGNLRSSIGYKVSNKNENSNFVEFAEPKNNKGSDGANKAKQLLQEVNKPEKGTIELTVVAGMDYALWVESMKGKNVLSSSIPKKSEIEKTLKELLG